MFKIKTMNTISELGTGELIKRGCEVGPAVENPEALLIRSADLHQYEFGPELLCIGRAGSGVNNIPLERCIEQGIAVFNSPGANAEAVKELEICSLILSSRDVLGSIDWVRSIADRGDEIPDLVEKSKSAFIGPEIFGKTLGVIGLGAVGALVANAALDLGMEVYGYDPYLSVSSAWMLSREVKNADSLDMIFANCDYISLNVPYTDDTYHMLNAEAFARMRPGVRIINESRAEIVDDDAMIAAIDIGKVSCYVTDFPNAKLIGKPNVVVMPHIGACTPESEEKCAIMAAKEIYNYLKDGSIKNSVNFPNAELERLGVCRLCVLHKNVPHMINSFLGLIGKRNINVEHMINKSRGEYAYTIIDLDEVIGSEITDKINEHPAVVRVRVL
ncbi:MAG TPA: 3-phosphoglycerate dehydrogenase [Clostridiales bacterium]|nr:3-phosphoglycerate dehydrogenase [Clostridiales bacterium]HBR08403.1 3-phosphoglycerate dehydrogenase [Clostridiales bacterium]